MRMLPSCSSIADAVHYVTISVQNLAMSSCCGRDHSNSSCKPLGAAPAMWRAWKHCPVQVISTLRGHDDKVRVVLNKADQVDQQQLMRVYGALMWSLSKVFRSPEVS